jgi:hypothetical protein
LQLNLQQQQSTTITHMMMMMMRRRRLLQLLLRPVVKPAGLRAGLQQQQLVAKGAEVKARAGELQVMKQQQQQR